MVVRYEDLVQHRTEEISRIADFLYEPFYTNNSITRKEIMQRISTLTTISDADMGIYLPKSFLSESTDPTISNNTLIGDNSVGMSNKEKQRNSDPGLRVPHLFIEPSKGGFLKSLMYFSNEQYKYILAASRSDLVRFGYWEGCVNARPHIKPDLIPYIDPGTNNCIIEDTDGLRLNSKYGLRPRYEKDPYGRGFDVRWEDRLKALPKPVVSESAPNRGIREDV